MRGLGQTAPSHSVSYRPRGVSPAAHRGGCAGCRWIAADELLLGIGLITGVGLPVVSYGSAALLLAFSATVIINLRRGREIVCACTGVADEQPISWGLVVRNGLLILAAV